VQARTSLLFAAVFLYSSLATWSHAQDVPTTESKQTQAKVFIDKAETHYRLSRFEEALVAYEKAYELFPVEEFLFNIGQCHRNLGHIDRAIFSFQAYLRDSKSESARKRVEHLVAELEEAKRQKADTQATASLDVVPPAPPPPPGASLEQNSSTAKVYEPPSPIFTRWWFWTAFAIGAAAVGGGIYLATEPADLEGSLGGDRWQ